MGDWLVLLKRLVRQIWFRAAMFCAAAVVLALLSALLGELLPQALSVDLGQNSVDSILQIIATSMLAVTTFSLATMVSAYSAATTTATPRATQLLIADPTSQNALSTFVGSFLFSIVGIVALSTGYYPEQGRTVLFFGTLVVIAIIVITLLRWISHLATFGRMADVIDRVEAAASDALRGFAQRPHLGARPAERVPSSARPVYAETSGFVTTVDVPALQEWAAGARARVHVLAIPGRAADSSSPLVRVEGALDEDGERRVRRAFRVEAHRTFEQDPRIGLIALSEIASRALSPATNDPGTAIEVLGALQRVFRELDTPVADEDPCDRVFAPRPVLRDLIEDAFRPIARDGAANIEVQLRLQKTLAALATAFPQHAGEFFRSAVAARRRADAALDDRDDRRLLRDVARDAWAP
ncbi:DUF2254 domain-containing protein [Microbacterium sp. LRZ72]|uniref:DUF2254 domain-containing protein n=1 Tax=Microbacterium sp. LRZ72 TaxID=2942481 RepID=UPI0029A8A8DF|nr:DUF2254 domain-containing protein [Microbacterium sp. LRZ72]MDX2375855.1 DUF2254 domain-containing protein [Microbacterium sp. LRZ72]